MEASLAEETQQRAVTLSPDSFFFMSPHRNLATSGCLTRLTAPAADGEDLNGEFQQRLRETFAAARKLGCSRPIVVGAIPFDTRKPSALFVPREYQSFSHSEMLASARTAAPPQLQLTAQQAIPEKTQFLDMVERAAALTATPDVRKVVLSRLIDISTASAPDRHQLLNRLVALNPGSYNFHVPLADGGALIGASPELLLRKENQHFWSLPLAGSARRHPNQTEDKLVGDRLLNSTKDRHEHQLVTQAMRQILAGRSQRLEVPKIPSLITTPTLWHLATAIAGETRSEPENALSLACLLHPTPALSGFPHTVARQVIAELEPFDRELFGGIVGWCDDRGNGEWAVAIRCARLKDNQIRCFAGAGIVPASVAESEWHETGVKLSTMLNVFGLNDRSV
ncbi:isochorismate synthase EntC [Atlantibacter hermannii]|uniref:isochorismate synthase EntC n=1 Tax=Atlantibacter hermannii TaxID=565 RepID=UPI003B2433BA